jgi:hypothetical protein
MNTFKTPKGTELPFLNLKGKDYLQVAHRLIWFREEKPDWSIITKATHFTQDFAVVEASIEDTTGRVIATANKMQTAKGFPGGYLEKAEAGAVGRALAFLGYGTAMAQELEEDEHTPMSQLSDSPIEQIKKAFPGSQPKITEPQAKRMYAIAKSKNWQPDEVKHELKKLGFTESKDLDRKNYDALIAILERGPEGSIL